jgi:hypothetical protein
MKVPAPERVRPTRRREALAGAALAAVAALVVAVVGLTAGPDDGTGTAASAPSSAPPSAPSSSAPPSPAAPTGPSTGVPVPPSPGPADVPVVPEPVPAGATGAADAFPVALPAVAFDAPAAGGDGVRAEVVSLEAVDGSGTGPGNVAGPALRVTVRLTGGAAGPVALDLVGVTLTHGADQIPASPLDDPSADPFGGSLEPGATAEGTYVFSVPEGDRDLVTLSVGYRADASSLVFAGAAP